MPRTKAKSATRSKAEVDRSLLLAVVDEINSLSALLRCQPSLNEATQLVRMVRDQENPSQRDRLAELGARAVSARKSKSAKRRRFTTPRRI